jgi:hypothetical protein
VSSTDADKLALKAQGVAGAQRLQAALNKGDLGYWDLTPAGVFTNPEANQAYQDAIEALARQNTGAAFTNTEDARFQKELGNANMLTTEKGRAAMAKAIDRFIDRQKGSGRTTWGNDGWLTQYGVGEMELGELSPDNSPLKIGDVEDGFRYKGGDFKDKNNWEKVE